MTRKPNANSASGLRLRSFKGQSYLRLCSLSVVWANPFNACLLPVTRVAGP